MTKMNFAIVSLNTTPSKFTLKYEDGGGDRQNRGQLREVGKTGLIGIAQ